MAAPDQEELLRTGANLWNQWRAENPTATVDLKGAYLPEADLRGINLCGADLSEAYLSWANLAEADLSRARLWNAELSEANLAASNLFGADLTDANLRKANLPQARLGEATSMGTNFSWANLRGANFSRGELIGADFESADLSRADLRESDCTFVHFNNANLTYANLSGANLKAADFVHTDLRSANLSNSILTGARILGCKLQNSDFTGCKVWGASVWDVTLEATKQKDLIITPEGQPVITVDNLDVAQFVYLLLNNERVRDVIDAITSKTVLILGRFTPERKETLDKLRDSLREKNYLPIVFDFERPSNRDFTETVSTLAHLARFVIADLTDPRSIPQELTAIIPRLLSVPICPLLLGDQREWGMFGDLARYPQVIKPFHYTDDAMLLSCLDSEIIGPAERMAQEIAGKKL